MRIGELVAEYREQHGISQREFAKMCNLSHVIISFLERGERANGEPYLPRYDTIRKIAAVIGKTPEEIIAGCDDFNIGVSVGPEETPIYADIFNQPPDEAMLIQAYRMIPVEYRMEAMQAIFAIKDKYLKK